MIILDTHVWLWWTHESSKLSHKATSAIENASIIGIPAISCWEIAMLVSKKRITLNTDVQIWINLALQRDKVKLLPLSPEIAVLSTQLSDNFHGDPADRLIVATSIITKSPLLTKDAKIQASGLVTTIWE